MFSFWRVKLRVNSRALRQNLRNENGQDLVEYAAVIVIVVLGLTAGMSTLASAINSAMTNVGSAISNMIG